jgi:hypothetical protein
MCLFASHMDIFLPHVHTTSPPHTRFNTLESEINQNTVDVRFSLWFSCVKEPEISEEHIAFILRIEK